MNPILQVPCGLAQPEITGGWRLLVAGCKSRAMLLLCTEGSAAEQRGWVGSENVRSSSVLLAIPCFPADRGMPALQSLVFPWLWHRVSARSSAPTWLHVAFFFQQLQIA